MKRSPLAMLFLVTLTGSLHAQNDRDERVYVDDRSSETLRVYLAPRSDGSAPRHAIPPTGSAATANRIGHGGAE